MTRYFLWLAAPLLAALVALMVLLVMAAGMPVKGNYWEVEGLRRKLALIEQSRPKLLVVAGSNAYFGVNAQDFASATGRNAVNLAMQGALPFDFYAALMRDVLKPGDIVVLPLEYAYYGQVHSSIRDRVAFLEASVALSMRPSYFSARPFADWLGFLRHLSLGRLWEAKWPETIDAGKFLRHLSLARLWEGAMERLRPSHERQYRVGVIDAWGDNVADYLTPESPVHLRFNVKEEASRGLTKFDADSPSVRSIVRFVEWARRRDVTVVAALPNTLDEAPFAGPELTELRRRIAGFWRQEGVPLLSVGATLGLEHILDTPYHPNLAGARVRTRLLLEEFCRAIETCAAGVGGEKRG